MFFDERLAAEYVANSVEQRISRTDSIKGELLRLYFRDGCAGGSWKSVVCSGREEGKVDRPTGRLVQRAYFHYNAFESIVRAPVWFSLCL